MKNKKSLILCSMLSIALLGCDNQISDSQSTTEDTTTISESSQESVSNSINSSSPIDSSSTENSSSMISSIPSDSSMISDSSSASIFDDVTYEVNENFEFEKYGLRNPQVETMSKLPNYVPTTFNSSTYKTTTTKISDGVEMVVAEYNLNNGSAVKPYCIVVDLNKANIVAGSYNNVTDSSFANRSVPYDQAQAWQKANPDKEFLAVTNADFFGSTTVNAFVKDGVVLKSAHNSDLNDVPVSKPMLFGVSKNGARIGPMTQNNNYNTNLNSTLKTKGVVVFNEDGTLHGNYGFVENSGLSANSIGIITTVGLTKAVKPGATVYLFKKINQSNNPDEVRGCIVKKIKTTVPSVKVEDDSYGYVIVGPDLKVKFTEGNYFSIEKDCVISDDGMWSYYDTILGCRHSLVENGVIPATVAKETSNGAQSRVPRTAVGIKDDGKVVIVSVEDLHYGNKTKYPTCTGLNLTQLADFMRYFGCYDAANFDGGGSSQLIAKVNNEYSVQTRSSDTSSSNLTSTRKVLNTIIVTTK